MRAESVVGSVRQSVVRRWLEVVLPLYAVALITVWFHAEYTPPILTASISESPLPAMAWAVVGALGGLLGLWALIIAFFLLYSPIYLIGKLPRLLGGGGWVDWREVRFYLACFGLLCLLAALAYWEPAVGLTAFAVAAGCGPVFWRVLV
jgi:putative copper export protein